VLDLQGCGKLASLPDLSRLVAAGLAILGTKYLPYLSSWEESGYKAARFATAGSAEKHPSREQL